MGKQDVKYLTDPFYRSLYRRIRYLLSRMQKYPANNILRTQKYPANNYMNAHILPRDIHNLISIILSQARPHVVNQAVEQRRGFALGHGRRRADVAPRVGFY